MDWNKFFASIIQLAVFSVFITSIIEVIKGISCVGLVGLLKGLWGSLVHNADLDNQAFPVLNFSIALLCCWAFDVRIMRLIISGSNIHTAVANWIDYFGVASVTYLGSQQLFDRFVDVENQAEAFKAAVTPTVPPGPAVPAPPPAAPAKP